MTNKISNHFFGVNLPIHLHLKGTVHGHALWTTCITGELSAHAFSLFIYSTNVLERVDLNITIPVHTWLPIKYTPSGSTADFIYLYIVLIGCEYVYKNLYWRKNHTTWTLRYSWIRLIVWTLNIPRHVTFVSQETCL